MTGRESLHPQAVRLAELEAELRVAFAELRADKFTAALAALVAECDAQRTVVAAAYVLKHEGRAEPLHDALYALEQLGRDGTAAKAGDEEALPPRTSSRPQEE